MSFESRTTELHQHFSDNFTGVAADKIAWPNIAFTTPTDGSAWIRVDVLETVTDFVSVGRSARTRRRGTFNVQVYVESDTGTAEAEQICDDVRITLEGQPVGSNIYFEETTKTRLGQSGGWYSILCTTPFYFDDILSL